MEHLGPWSILCSLTFKKEEICYLITSTRARIWGALHSFLFSDSTHDTDQMWGHGEWEVDFGAVWLYSVMVGMHCRCAGPECSCDRWPLFTWSVISTSEVLGFLIYLH